MTELTTLQNFFSTHKNSRVRKAFEISEKAHADQIDKAGAKYIYHPMTVAFNCSDNDSAIIIALLHDTVEDTAITFDELKEAVPLTDDEFNALKLLTHDKAIPYLDYVQRIKSNELAKRIKIADLKHNSDLSRIPKEILTEKDFSRVEKYQSALKILNED